MMASKNKDDINKGIEAFKYLVSAFLSLEPMLANLDKIIHPAYKKTKKYKDILHRFNAVLDIFEEFEKLTSRLGKFESKGRSPANIIS